MPRIIFFREFDPWHTGGRVTGFNKTGYVTEDDIVIYPRRSRIARKPAPAITKKGHTILPLTYFPRADRVEKFFTQNVINITMYAMGMRMLAEPSSPFWDNPIKLPVLQTITPDEFEAQWRVMLSVIRIGDYVFTLDTKSRLSQLIVYLDQGTWGHVGCYTGNGNVAEAITAGVVERPIDAYHNSRFRLGIYRLDRSQDDIDARSEFLRSQLGKPYAFKKVLALGARMLVGLPHGKVTPNMMPAILRLRLVHTT